MKPMLACRLPTDAPSRGGKRGLNGLHVVVGSSSSPLYMKARLSWPTSGTIASCIVVVALSAMLLREWLTNYRLLRKALASSESTKSRTLKEQRGVTTRG